MPPGIRNIYADHQPSQTILDTTRQQLYQRGWVRHEAPEGLAAATLLVRALRHHPTPDVGTLTDAAHQFIGRSAPRALGLRDHPSAFASSPPLGALWVDPLRVYPNREYRDRGDWTREPEPVRVRPEDPIRGLAEFARRIAREQADPRGLVELLGPSDYDSRIDLIGWGTPLGAFFHINHNGKHRAAAFALLGVPCVLATVIPGRLARADCHGPKKEIGNMPLGPAQTRPTSRFVRPRRGRQ